VETAGRIARSLSRETIMAETPSVGLDTLDEGGGEGIVRIGDAGVAMRIEKAGRS